METRSEEDIAGLAIYEASEIDRCIKMGALDFKSVYPPMRMFSEEDRGAPV